MKTLKTLIMEAEYESARWLMKANDLRERGKTCAECGGGFLPVVSETLCRRCIRGKQPKPTKNNWRMAAIARRMKPNNQALPHGVAERTPNAK